MYGMRYKAKHIIISHTLLKFEHFFGVPHFCAVPLFSLFLNVLAHFVAYATTADFLPLRFKFSLYIILIFELFEIVEELG